MARRSGSAMTEGNTMTTTKSLPTLDEMFAYKPEQNALRFEVGQVLVQTNETHRFARLSGEYIEMHALTRGYVLDSRNFQDFATPAVVFLVRTAPAGTQLQLALTPHASGYLAMHRSLDRYDAVLLLQLAETPNRTAPEVWATLEQVYLDYWSASVGGAHSLSEVSSAQMTPAQMAQTLMRALGYEYSGGELAVMAEPAINEVLMAEQRSGESDPLAAKPGGSRTQPLSTEGKRVGPENDSAKLWGFPYLPDFRPNAGKSPKSFAITDDLLVHVRKFDRPVDLPDNGRIVLNREVGAYFTGSGIVIESGSCGSIASEINSATRAVLKQQQMLIQAGYGVNTHQGLFLIESLHLTNVHAAASLMAGYITSITDFNN